VPSAPSVPGGGWCLGSCSSWRHRAPPVAGGGSGAWPSSRRPWPVKPWGSWVPRSGFGWARPCSRGTLGVPVLQRRSGHVRDGVLRGALTAQRADHGGRRDRSASNTARSCSQPWTSGGRSTYRQRCSSRARCYYTVQTLRPGPSNVAAGRMAALEMPSVRPLDKVGLA
jgi:hypothetical protein